MEQREGGEDKNMRKAEVTGKEQSPKGAIGAGRALSVGERVTQKEEGIL